MTLDSRKENTYVNRLVFGRVQRAITSTLVDHSVLTIISHGWFFVVLQITVRHIVVLRCTIVPISRKPVAQGLHMSLAKPSIENCIPLSPSQSGG